MTQKNTVYDGITIRIAIEDLELMCWTGRMNLESWPFVYLPLEIVSEIRRLEDE